MGNIKISGYLTTLQLTRGFFVALFASLFLYLAWFGWSHPLPNTIFAILALYLLLRGDRKVWLVSGFFISIFWFWWIMMSFRLYGFPWAIPIGIFLMALVYAILFWTAALLSEVIEKHFHLSSLWFKALFLLTVSGIHPFGFDWFKPELMLTESYLGIEKWHFALILFALVMAIKREKLRYLILVLLAYQPTIGSSDIHPTPDSISEIEIVTTYIPIAQKWDPKMLPKQVALVMQEIDDAIRRQRELIIFPESVLPIFLNREQSLLSLLRDKSHNITIVMGALKWDDGVLRNSTYIFKAGELKIADKVVLVPFGESNPLPKWLSNQVNQIFYDGAVDYKASAKISDYSVNGTIYRNAICYEACSEQLYQDDPKQMIVLSNNGWFTPSIEPTQQRLLLQYYSRKYGTMIYHSINMSPSYVIKDGKVIWHANL
ncbi:MAG: apolipoprotein N-acyltransferase [Campylobacterota bacterium]|nr:apolipoprotein N-acyltransferase [Campylobacterota bacterium]